MTDRITFPCARCQRPVTHDTGYVHMPEADLAAARSGRQAWRRRQESKLLVYGSDLLDCPGPARWRVHHESCDPNPDAGDYWLPLSSVDTCKALLETTAHLMGKGWLRDTDWPEFLRSAASRTPTTETERRA